jgi:hypothetical protein
MIEYMTYLEMYKLFKEWRSTYYDTDKTILSDFKSKFRGLIDNYTHLIKEKTSNGLKFRIAHNDANDPSVINMD